MIFFTNFDYFEFIVEHENINLKFVGVRDKFDLITGKELGYDNVIILPVTSKTLGPRLKPDILLDYFNAGGNLLAFTSEKALPMHSLNFSKNWISILHPRIMRLLIISAILKKSHFLNTIFWNSRISHCLVLLLLLNWKMKDSSSLQRIWCLSRKFSPCFAHS